MSNPKACIVSISGERLRPEEALFLAQTNPWGVILMGRSVNTKSQVRALIDEIWAALGRACLIFIDQEGGRVRRMRPPEWPDFPAAAVYASIYDLDPELGVEASWLGHRLMANEMAPIGIHADCAPVVDLRHKGAHDIIGDRSFGEFSKKVVDLCRAALDGLAAGAVAGVIKHMPGHGRALSDSHEALPVVDAAAEEIAVDFEPFSQLADAPMGMTAHVAFTALDGMTPATVSRKIINDVIRTRIGFSGLLMSDDLGMKALGGSLADRTRSCFAAGCDIALHCAGFEPDPDKILDEMRQVAGAAPALSGRSQHVAETAESVTLQADEFDAEAGWERFRQLLAMPMETGV